MEVFFAVGASFFLEALLKKGDKNLAGNSDFLYCFICSLAPAKQKTGYGDIGNRV